MKIKKGTFKVAHAEGLQEQEGSYAIAFPLYIHRTEDEKLWKVSHLATGYNVRAKLTLEQARSLVRSIKDYPLFLTPTIDTFTKQLEIMQTKKPLQHKELMHRINNYGATNE